MTYWSAAPNRWWDCESAGCYRDASPDWSPYNKCFGESRIRFSDIDGVV